MSDSLVLSLQQVRRGLIENLRLVDDAIYEALKSEDVLPRLPNIRNMGEIFMREHGAHPTGGHDFNYFANPDVWVKMSEKFQHWTWGNSIRLALGYCSGKPDAMFAYYKFNIPRDLRHIITNKDGKTITKPFNISKLR